MKKINIAQLLSISSFFILSSLSNATAAPSYKWIAHQVDVQNTFSESYENQPYVGTLAVPGSASNIENIKKISKRFYELSQKGKAKTVSSMDFHFEVEMKVKGVNDEFFAPYFFPSHGRAEFEHSAEGHSRISEVEDLFSDKNKVIIPHHIPNADNTALTLVPVSLNSMKKDIFNSKNEILIYKNGQNSYDVFSNPRAEKIYEMINPKKLTPVFVYGWATDICVRAAALGLRARGYKTILVTDASSGVFKDKTALALEEMKNAGVEFMTTNAVLDLLK